MYIYECYVTENSFGFNSKNVVIAYIAVAMG